MNISSTPSHNFTINNSVQQNKLNTNKCCSNVLFRGTPIPSESAVMSACIKKNMDSKRVGLSDGIAFNTIFSQYLPTIINPKNFINSGKDARVYRINNEYVIRLSHQRCANKDFKVYDMPKRSEQPFVNLDFYYGEPLIKSGDIEILRNAAPTKNVIVCGAEYKPYLTTLEIEEKQRSFIPICAALPQKSYDEFAKGLNELNAISKKEHGYSTYFMPDINNPNNLLISDGKFKVVDSLDKTTIEQPNSFYTMVEPLLVKLNPYTYAEPSEALTKQRQEIYKKCLIAAEKNNLPLYSDVLDINADSVLEELIGTMGTSHWDVMRMREQGVSLEKRLAYINSL